MMQTNKALPFFGVDKPSIFDTESLTIPHIKKNRRRKKLFNPSIHSLAICHRTISEMSLFNLCRSASIVLRRSMFAFFSAFKFFRASEEMLDFCKLVKVTINALDSNVLNPSTTHIHETESAACAEQKQHTNIHKLITLRNYLSHCTCTHVLSLSRSVSLPSNTHPPNPLEVKSLQTNIFP